MAEANNSQAGSSQSGGSAEPLPVMPQAGGGDSGAVAAPEPAKPVPEAQSTLSDDPSPDASPFDFSELVDIMVEDAGASGTTAPTGVPTSVPDALSGGEVGASKAEPEAAPSAPTGQKAEEDAGAVPAPGAQAGEPGAKEPFEDPVQAEEDEPAEPVPQATVQEQDKDKEAEATADASASAAPASDDVFELARQQLEANRSVLEEAIASEHYKLSDDLAELVETDPAQAIPKVAAKVYLDAVTGVMGQLGKVLPAAVSAVLQAKEKETAAEREFYKAWPDLDPQRDGEVVARIAQVYRQLNPDAPFEQFVRDVGAQAMIAVKGAQAAATQAPAATVPATPAPQAGASNRASGSSSGSFQPAAAAPVAPSAPAANGTNPPPNPFAEMAAYIAREG